MILEQSTESFVILLFLSKTQRIAMKANCFASARLHLDDGNKF